MLTLVVGNVNGANANEAITQAVLSINQVFNPATPHTHAEKCAASNFKKALNDAKVYASSNNAHEAKETLQAWYSRFITTTQTEPKNYPNILESETGLPKPNSFFAYYWKALEVLHNIITIEDDKDEQDLQQLKQQIIEGEIRANKLHNEYNNLWLKRVPATPIPEGKELNAAVMLYIAAKDEVLFDKVHLYITEKNQQQLKPKLLAKKEKLLEEFGNL